MVVPEVKILTAENVQNVTRPKITYEEIIIDSYNSVIPQGKHAWEQITVTVRDDITNRQQKQLVLTFFLRQVNFPTN